MKKIEIENKMSELNELSTMPHIVIFYDKLFTEFEFDILDLNAIKEALGGIGVYVSPSAESFDEDLFLSTNILFVSYQGFEPSIKTLYHLYNYDVTVSWEDKKIIKMPNGLYLSLAKIISIKNIYDRNNKKYLN